MKMTTSKAWASRKNIATLIHRVHLLVAIKSLLMIYLKRKRNRKLMKRTSMLRWSQLGSWTSQNKKMMMLKKTETRKNMLRYSITKTLRYQMKKMTRMKKTLMKTMKKWAASKKWNWLKSTMKKMTCYTLNVTSFFKCKGSMVAESMSCKSAICLVRTSHLFTIKAIDIDRGIQKMQASLLLEFTPMFNKGNQMRWFQSQDLLGQPKTRAMFIILSLISYQPMQKVHSVKDLAYRNQLKKSKENKLKLVIIKSLQFSRF